MIWNLYFQYADIQICAHFAFLKTESQPIEANISVAGPLKSGSDTCLLFDTLLTRAPLILKALVNA